MSRRRAPLRWRSPAVRVGFAMHHRLHAVPPALQVRERDLGQRLAGEREELLSIAAVDDYCVLGASAPSHAQQHVVAQTIIWLRPYSDCGFIATTDRPNAAHNGNYVPILRAYVPWEDRGD